MLPDPPPMKLPDPPAIVRPAEPARDYPAFQKAIDAGTPAVLAVGVAPQPGDYTVAELRNADGSAVTPGRWACRKAPSGYVWSAVTPPPTLAPAFTPTPFTPFGYTTGGT